MLTVQLHPDTVGKLRSELAAAQRREIGGCLVGEHVGPDFFRIVDISVQRSGGNAVCFVRRPADHKRFFDNFFRRSGEQFTRFNYLGEWHSHPSFTTDPSDKDLQAMQRIVEDPDVPRNFAVLLIVRLDKTGKIVLNARVFLPGRPSSPVKIDQAPRPDSDRKFKAPTLWEWLFAPPPKTTRRWI
jgi:[CysO sulfur-carrier protein]-S-L-cysteine hydrolase